MKTLVASIRFLIVMTLLTGFIYPLAVTGFAKVFFAEKTSGDTTLIAQKFVSEKYFRPRPSAIDYNPMPSGGSNLGPTSQDLLAKVKERKTAGATEDLLYASASGLDPHISPKAAYGQIARVAKARGVNDEKLHDIVEKHTEGRQLGFLGEERVNVLELNLSLDQMK